MSRCGFTGFMHEWLSDYLANRLQTVKVAGMSSEACFINVGVPQGSVLGPILFLIYINAIFSVKLKGKTTVFADDLGCCYSADSMLDLISNINHDVELLRFWFGNHKLVVSKKTKLLFFNLPNLYHLDNCIGLHCVHCKKFYPNKLVAWK